MMCKVSQRNNKLDPKVAGALEHKFFMQEIGYL